MSEPWYILPPNEAWQRRQQIYERHEAGETYAAIAKDMQISTARANQLSLHWRRRLRLAAAYNSNFIAGKATDHATLVREIYGGQ